MTNQIEHLDVILVGAGLSGIGGAYYLQKKCPNKSFTILESRDVLGGTWEFFRYPGIRSDSDMQTMAFSFKPWTAKESIAEGHLILDYLKETVKEYGIDKKIRYGHKVTAASWSSDDKKWTLQVEKEGKMVTMTCNYLISCAGYYKYDQGYKPDFKGMKDFNGTVVHPNQWPKDLDHSNKKVVIIGSGATAVTLLPNMAKTAAHVTMLQRTPGYLFPLPSIDGLESFLRKILPMNIAYRIVRWRNIIRQEFYFRLSRKYPAFGRKMIDTLVKKELGEQYNEKDFTPPYNPWDQRICATPDADFFRALKQDNAEIKTDQIDTFTKNGLKLKSGEELTADIIVTATGFNIQYLGGMKVSIDDQPVDISKHVNYRGLMLHDMPNFFNIMGYFYASWPLKLDPAFDYICRIINRMDKTGHGQVTPRLPQDHEKAVSVFDESGFTPGYLSRAESKNLLPLQMGSPWKTEFSHMPDIKMLKYGSIDGKELEYK